MAYDVETIKAGVDLVDLIGQDVTLKRVAAGNDGEYAGPCPKCGGTDRFHVEGRGLWMCRQCHPDWTDAIGYLRWRHDLTFGEACERLGGLKDAVGGDSTRKPRKDGAKAPELATAQPPSAVWQERGREFIAYATTQLWKNEQALAYLHGRGLDDETIRRADLGYNPKGIADVPARWDLEETSAFIARGWVIPWYAEGLLWAVKIRRPEEDRKLDPKTGKPDAKYVSVHRPEGCTSRGLLYGADTLGQGEGDVILTEGEFDCLLLRQYVGDLVGVATLGTASEKIGALTLPHLIRARRLWLAYDADPAGRKTAETMQGVTERARPIPWPEGLAPEVKDVTDLHRAGFSLVDWVVGKVGPSSRDAWLTWAEYYLDGLWNGAGDETSYTWQVWRALLARFEEVNRGQ